MRRRGEQTVPAEWEIAIGYALLRVGVVVDPGDEKPGNPDYILIPRGSNTEVLVEVTALSDKAADTENPVNDFVEKLGHLAVKEEITPQLGALHWSLGDIEHGDRIVIGVPERVDMDAFFKGCDFRSFLSEIKAAPTEQRTFHFVARGAQSIITFQPGQRFAEGGCRQLRSRPSDQ